MPLQVDLRDWLCTQQHWAEDPGARGPSGWDSKPFLQIRLGNEVELLQVGLVEVVDSQVISQGRQGIPDVDGHLKLPSDFGLVNIRQFGAKLVLEKVQVILGSVVVGHYAPQELVGVGLQRFQLHLLTADGVDQGEGHWLRLAAQQRQGPTFRRFKGEAHARGFELDLVLQLLVFWFVVGHQFEVISERFRDYSFAAEVVSLLFLLGYDGIYQG